VTAPREKTPEEIEYEMAQTRAAITEKVSALENQVVGTVKTAADTLTGTVEAVKSIVTHAPEAVSDSVKQAAAAVKETFNVTGFVSRNPWTSVGSSALLGCIVGWLVFRDGSRAGASVPAPFTGTPVAPAAAATASGKPGILDEFVGMLGDKAKEMARTALETVSAAVKENIEKGVPQVVNHYAEGLTSAGRDETNSSMFGARGGNPGGM